MKRCSKYLPLNQDQVFICINVSLKLKFIEFNSLKWIIKDLKIEKIKPPNDHYEKMVIVERELKKFPKIFSKI